jgi:hypothetical protein
MTDAEYLDWFNREFWRTLHGPGVASLSRLQRDALCVMNFQAELNNGGMHQYLLNSSGDFGPILANGTAAGTVVVKDINHGSSGSYPNYLTNVNGLPGERWGPNQLPRRERR